MHGLQYELFAKDGAVPQVVAGVDEAGRGPLSGSVFAAAVILNPNKHIDGLRDSKKLTEKQRQYLASQIRRKALAWSVASSSVAEIEQLNILQATMLAMKRACESLEIIPDIFLIDGNKAPSQLPRPALTVIKGDLKFSTISAASILAKTARDQESMHMHNLYPEYGFNKHKGYATAEHLEMLNKYGPCPEHRKNFSPVKKLVKQD